MNNPIDAVLSRWNLTDPNIPIILSTWTAVHPGRMNAAMAAIATLPLDQRAKAINTSQALTSLERSTLRTRSGAKP